MEMLYLYALCLYGVSLSQIKKLVVHGISLKDFEDKTDRINYLVFHKPALVKSISEIIPSIKREELEDNLYQLAHEGISGGMIKSLIDSNINYHDLNNLSLEKFNEMMGGNRVSVYNKIITAFEKVERIKKRIPLRKIKESIRNILSDLEIDETLSVEQIEGILSSKFNIKINVELIKLILDELYSTNYINYHFKGVKRFYPKIMDYLKGEFKDKEIFLKRLQGQTLAQLASDFQYSRQGIRNIETRVIKRMPVFEEDLRYRADFEKIDFPQELFCMMFEEPIEVYNYLNAKYSKGNQVLLDDIFNMKYTDLQRRMILRFYNRLMNKQGEIKEISKMSIFEEVVAKYALDTVTDSDILQKFNEFIIKNNLPKAFLSEISSLRGISERSNNIIRGKGNTYRYYDFDIVSEDIIKYLIEYLELDSGVYSMKKIFTENPEQMDEIDIRTEYELHNLYRRKIKVDNVNYTRMPEFTVGNINKKDFLIGLFKELSPISLKEFVVYIEEIYGLRQDSLSSYIVSFLFEYLHEDIIKTDYVELSAAENALLKSLLIKPIYTIEEVKKIGIAIRQDFDENFINNMTLTKVNYQIRNNFVLSDRFNSIDDYFRNRILSEDYFINEHLAIYRTQSFGTVLYNLEKNFEIFKIEKDVYITYKKLSGVGVTLDEIMDYKKALIEFIGKDENKYFTIHSIREEGFEHPLDELGFSQIFYERLIWAFEEFRAIQTSTSYILKKANTTLSLREFLYHYVSEKRVVKLEDLVDDIEKVYNVMLETSKVIYLLRQSDVFYSEELYKFYIDKEDFFEEVYE